MAIDFGVNSLLSNENFLKSVNTLYGGGETEHAKRVSELCEHHGKNHGGEIRLFSSPGRIEVSGNHTDHNNGKALCASVTIDTLAAVTKRDDNFITIDSIGYPLVTVDITDLNIYEEEKETSEALVRGVVKAMLTKGYRVGGFAATTTSNVFKGAGVSSSAAFEVLTTEILNVLYNDGKIDKMEKALMAQYAENVYFGKPSGLLDQSAISLGGVSYIDFENPKNPAVKNVSWNFKDVGVVIVNCGGDHSNLTPCYASIRKEMESVAAFFGEETLRFVSEDAFYENMTVLKEKFSGRAILRAIHFFEENKRVDKLLKAIDEGDEQTAMSMIISSGDSSYKLLQNVYPEGTEEQPVALGLALSARFDGVRAYRVHGGGFAGTILNFVELDKIDAYSRYMSKLYGEKNVFILGIRPVGATEVKL